MLKMLPALAALAAASALLVPTVSKAQDTRSTRVSYADLDLASAAGQDVLQKRIAYGAMIVCDGGFYDATEMPLALACRSDAIAGAEPAFKAAVAAATLHPSVTVGVGAALIVSRP